MTAALIGLAAAVTLSGVFLAIIGALTAPPPLSPVAPAPSPRARLRAAWRHQTPGRQRLILAALAAGVLGYGLTLWVPALVIIPAASAARINRCRPGVW